MRFVFTDIKIRDFVFIFCLVFSFYIVSFVQSSMLIGGISLIYILSNYKKTRSLLSFLGNRYCFPILFFPLFIITNCLLFSMIHFTFDFSYLKSVISLYIKIFFIFFAVEYIYTRNKNIEYYEKIIVYIFTLQSIIQIVAFLNPSIANILHYFNHAGELYVREGGRRGLALSGGTGWSLGLTYGLSFIFYTKLFLLKKKISFYSIIIGIFLLLGVFFSGRSAYFGIVVSIIYFFLSKRMTLYSKIKIIILFCFFLLLSIFTVYLVFYDFANFLVDRIFPWAFEFFYQLDKTGKLQTGSTNRLLEMWQEAYLITSKSILLGEGYFTDPLTNRYYHMVDVGYLRNIFYWGIFGSIFIYTYQVMIFIKILLSEDKEKILLILSLLFYLFVMELKAMTVGFNHISMTICIMYSLLNIKYSLNKGNT